MDRDNNQPSYSWVVYSHSPTAFSEKESVQIIQHVLGRYWIDILRWMSNKAGTHEYSTNATQGFLTYSRSGYLHECACKSCILATYELLSSATYVSLRWTLQVLLLRRERFLTDNMRQQLMYWVLSHLHFIRLWFHNASINDSWIWGHIISSFLCTQLVSCITIFVKKQGRNSSSDIPFIC